MTEEEKDYTAWGDEKFYELCGKIKNIDIEDSDALHGEIVLGLFI